MAEEKPPTLREILNDRSIDGVIDALEEMYADYHSKKKPPEPEPVPLPPAVVEGEVIRG